MGHRFEHLKQLFRLQIKFEQTKYFKSHKKYSKEHNWCKKLNKNVQISVNKKKLFEF